MKKVGLKIDILDWFVKGIWPTLILIKCQSNEKNLVIILVIKPATKKLHLETF